MTAASRGIATINGVLTPAVATRDYTDVLPSMNLVAEITPDFLVRLGAAKTMARPGLGSLSPGVTVSVSGSAKTVSAGNPALDPQRAKTVDLGFEWYFDEGAMLGLGLFHKEIESFIQTTREEINKLIANAAKLAEAQIKGLGLVETLEEVYG